MTKNQLLTENDKELDNAFDDQNSDTQKILSNIRKIRILNIWYVRIFLTILFLVAILSLIIPLRPKYSETEKRNLTLFPKFSFSALFSGEYFDGINEWYSDTFPFRESLTDLNANVARLYGKTNVLIHGVVENGDEIPSVPSQSEEESKPDESSSEAPQTESSAAESPSEPPVAAPPPVQTLGALLVNGDTAFEYYNFNQNLASTYVNSINRAAALLDGKATVYDIIVPTSMGITAPDEILAGVNTSNQKNAIDYMFSGMSPAVKKVGIYDSLKNHKNEYIYFRTDHHWTALGAYYAYNELMNIKGVIPAALDTFIPREFPGYLGSFYTISGKLPQLAANPDTVMAYQPTQTNLIHIQGKNGAWFDSEIISDMSATSSKYLTFIKGDYPFSIINNPSLADNSACIVVKESFGNAFVPFLVPHYQNIYVVDYRYFSTVDPRGLAQLRDETAATDVIFINNVSATRNKSLVAAIDAFIR